MKRTIKRILTGVTCLVVVAAIVSLCSIAYFKEQTQPKNNTIQFASVRVSESVDFKTMAPTNTSIDYDKNGYYLTLYRMKSNTNISYSPKVTNNGEKPIVAYIVVSLPRNTVEIDGEKVTNDIFNITVTPQTSENGYWIRVESNKISTVLSDALANKDNYNEIVAQNILDTKGDFTYIVYGYSRMLEPGETTEGLNATIKALKTDNNFNDENFELKDGYRKVRIQTSAVGLQEPICVTDAIDNNVGTYSWDSYDKNTGREAILRNAWQYIAKSEFNMYLFRNVYIINDDVNDNPRPKSDS